LQKGKQSDSVQNIRAITNVEGDIARLSLRMHWTIN